jgi:hypothetical protein
VINVDGHASYPQAFRSRLNITIHVQHKRLRS